ncbi:hypothetical protein NJR55_07620 [Idiomarina sp. M1R2S28]|uniref:Uncharacterized protein n=1 Tax=Idiomarina rhizosphaerae TaxID=2961572 RepID=A0A9X2JRK3_9GAMM|nr:hypothetical protein [Idiomarina rhizosphaerae]MCP1339462.1 hypothetical protein [Idiomarina rhizosphaerae]
MTSTLHWLRNSSLVNWLEQHDHLLSDTDALLMSGVALNQLPPESPVELPVYARKQEADALDTALPDYVVVLKSDEQWVELVLSFQQQITW